MAPQPLERGRSRKWRRPAVENIGIDVHKNQSQVCILTDNAELIEKRIRTDRARFGCGVGCPFAGKDSHRSVDRE